MPDSNPAFPTTPPAPNREYPGSIMGRDGNPKYPANDADAKAAGLDKCVKVSDSSVSYRYPPDRKEMVLSGAYTWTPWP